MKVLTLNKRRSFTEDRAPPDNDRVQVFTVEQLGPNMSKLPNGNLLCRNVPIARVGWMFYGPGETPIQVGDDGIARIWRGEDDVFNEITMGSCAGAAVVDDHPEDDVTPKNWSKLARGFALDNIRRGEGEEQNCLLADLMITDAKLITAILTGKREVSTGYDADYDQTGPGEGKQSNIVVNHIALVEKGRCGPRCSIGDRFFNPDEKEFLMPTPRVKILSRKAQVLDAARQKVADAEAELKAAEAAQTGDGSDDPDDGAIHIHMHTGLPGEVGGAGVTQDDDPVETRFKKIEDGLAKVTDSIGQMAEGIKSLTQTRDAATERDEDDDDDDEDDGTGDRKGARDEGGEGDPGEEGTPAGEGEGPEGEPAKDRKMKDRKKARDSAALETAYTALMAKAEILVPGFRIPTFDAARKRTATVDSMCGARRKALDLAYTTKDGKELVDSVAGRDVSLSLAKMDCVNIAGLFNSAAGAKKLLNNRAGTSDGKMATVQTVAKTGPKSIAELNEINRKYHAPALKPLSKLQKEIEMKFKRTPVALATVRARTTDVAFTYRMGAGFPGDVNRTHPTSILPGLINVTNPPALYGNPVVIDGPSASYRGIIATDLGLAAPVATGLTTSTEGGTGLAATTAYFYKLTAFNDNGETITSNEETVTTGAGDTNSNTLTWTALPGAVGYYIYRGTVTNTENVRYQVGLVTTFVDTGAAGVAASPPAVNTTALSMLKGIAVRPYPTQQTTGGMSSTLGAATPPVSGVMDFLREGYMLVTCNNFAVNQPTKGGLVYVWCAASTGNHVQGGFEARRPRLNYASLGNAFFNGPTDSAGVTEIEVRAN